MLKHKVPTLVIFHFFLFHIMEYLIRLFLFFLLMEFENAFTSRNRQITDKISI